MKIRVITFFYPKPIRYFHISVWNTDFVSTKCRLKYLNAFWVPKTTVIFYPIRLSSFFILSRTRFVWCVKRPKGEQSMQLVFWHPSIWQNAYCKVCIHIMITKTKKWRFSVFHHFSTYTVYVLWISFYSLFICSLKNRPSRLKSKLRMTSTLFFSSSFWTFQKMASSKVHLGSISHLWTYWICITFLEGKVWPFILNLLATINLNKLSESNNQQTINIKVLYLCNLKKVEIFIMFEL